MKKGKVILSFAMATGLMLAMFSGCAKSGSSAPSSSSGTPSSSSKPKATVTLNIYTGDKNIQGLSRVQDAVNAYLKSKNTGLQIKWTTMSWDTLGVKLNTMLQTGQSADVINTASWIGGGYTSWASSGYLTDLTPYITDPNNSDLVKIIGQDFLDGTKVQGKYYGLPTNKEKAHNFGFLMQTDEMNKVGIDPSKIHSLTDLEPYFDKVKADGFIPIVLSAMDNPFKELDWDVINGDDNTPGAFDPTTDMKTVLNQFTDPKSVAFYKLMKTFYSKGWISKSAQTAQGEEEEMKSGKYFMGSWSLMPGKAVTEEQSLGLKLTQINITPVEKSNRETLGALTAIPKASAHPAQAFQFMKMLYTDKTLINLMTFGQEGTDYTMDTKADNTIDLNPNSTFKSAGGWILGNEFNDYLTSNQSPTLWDDIQKYNDSAKPLTSLGFIFNNANVKTQFAACDATVKKDYPALFDGAVPNVDAAVSSFEKELKADGVDQLIAEEQSQYNAFLSSKS